MNIMRMCQVCKILGVKDHQVRYAIQSGKVQEPLQILGQSAFTDGDVERLRAYFARLGTKWQRKPRQEQEPQT